MTFVKIKEVAFSFDDFQYRAPMKFRATVVDQVTLLNVRVRVRSIAGAEGVGFGSMTLGNVWSFPSSTLRYEDTLAAMKQLAGKIAAIAETSGISGDPIELSHQLEPQYLAVAGAIPTLCTLVVASAFDAAMHDAFGKLLGLNCYQTYGPEYVAHDLRRYLDPRFKGEYLDRYISEQARPCLYVYHLVGALDALTAADLDHRVNDGLPETLEEWVRAEGVDHIKIKLDGDNLEWDVNRTLSVNKDRE